MKKLYKITNNHGEIISRHKTLAAANRKLRSVDGVKYALTATDVRWLSGKEEALQGYRYNISA